MASTKATVAAVLVCAHCSLTFFVVLGGLALAGVAVPTVLGVRLDMLLIPLAGIALFALWLWWGRREALAAEACAQPISGSMEPMRPSR